MIIETCIFVYGRFRVEIRTIKRLKSHSTKLPAPKGCVAPPSRCFFLSFILCTLNCCLVHLLNFRLLRSCVHTTISYRTNDFVITLIHTRNLLVSCFFLLVSFDKILVCYYTTHTTQHHDSHSFDFTIHFNFSCSLFFLLLLLFGFVQWI